MLVRRRKQKIRAPHKRMWNGLCDCGTESLYVMATFELSGAMSSYALDAYCSWCDLPWRLPVPPKETA